MGDGNRYIALDGLRGVFALSVAMYHFYAGDSLIGQTWYTNLFLLVDFFFVLSGFVIWTAYGARVSDGPAAAGFLVKRFGRVWPLHVVVLLALVMLECVKLAISMVAQTDTAAFAGTSSLPALAASVTLVHALGFFETTVWNGPSWSISVEMFAYVVFALIAMTPRRAQLLTWVILLVSLAAVSASGDYLTAATRFGFPRCLAGFSIGVLIAMARTRHVAGSRASATVWEIAACAGVIAVLMFTYSRPATLLALPVFALGVWVFAAEGGAVSQILKTPVFRYLGERSYAIYIVHFLVVRSLFRVGQTFETVTGSTIYTERTWSALGLTEEIWTLVTPNWAATVAAYAVYAVLVLAVAEVGYRWVEQPWRRWFRRYADGLEQRLRERRGSDVAVATKP